MQHIDPDDLAVIAFDNNSLTAEQEQHLAQCDQCADELHGLHRTVVAGRTAIHADLLSPPTTMWAKIQTELSMPVASETIEPTATADHTSESSATDAPVIPLRRTRKAWPLLVAAGVVGILGGLVISGLWQIPSDAVIAEASLEPLPGWSAAGSAAVSQNNDGQRDVLVSIEGEDETESGVLREVWLLNADATGLVSLGFLDGDTGTFVIPAGIDLEQYPLVDVSAEPNNGDPNHSGDSIVRGELRTT
ncbi:MAG TPA: anti-sigma factor [Glaciihabitans sp.]|jgi:hypothetical protein|nr:anti-sigma factor [Glaciihabitans sp.]